MTIVELMVEQIRLEMVISALQPSIAGFSPLSRATPDEVKGISLQEAKEEHARIRAELAALVPPKKRRTHTCSMGEMNAEESAWFEDHVNENYPGWEVWNKKLYQVRLRIIGDKMQEAIEETAPELSSKQKAELKQKLEKIVAFAADRFED